jgi:beta-galactosidase
MDDEMSFTVADGYFVKNGKPTFVVSGEIHYFRIDPRLWGQHLVLLKRTGANATSTYIPWDWHEYEEKKFDFSGKTNPSRNLLKYMELCKKIGLQLIVKPGPYILAEYDLHGLPSWLIERCGKNARALDEHGNVIARDRMSYMSEEFLSHVFCWYDQIMPLLARHQESEGGPITMMQVCNEVGLFQWLSGKVDYNDSVTKLHREFLKNRYGTIENLNRKYETLYTTFGDVVAPRGCVENRQQYRAYYDFHLFYRDYYALYLDILVKRIRAYGMDVLLTHNIPGWIYGSAAELPMLISTYAQVMKTRRDIVFGLDHIPEFVSFRNAGSDLACNKILQALQPSAPVWAAELQAGTREHQVKNDANDMRTFYFASLAHGLKSFNYYMFSQGVNPKGKGYYGKTFYFQTPLSDQCEKSDLYEVTKEIGSFINRELENLLLSETKASVCVGFYKPYFCTELTSSQILKERKLHVERLGLSLDPRFVREEIFFNGMLRALQTMNIGYDISDLENPVLDSLLKYKQLWVATTEFMDGTTQEFLVSYVKQGGHLVIYPAIPTLDEYLHACTILKDGLNLQFEQSTSPRKIDAFGIEEVYTFLEEKQVFSSADSDAVARTMTGEVCGLRKRVGKGFVTALGFAFGYTTDDHLLVYEKIIAFDHIKREAKVSDPDIQFVIRKGKKYSYLFLLNYHNARKTFTVGSRKHSLGPFSCKVIKRK